jgi:hypothetical protein
MNIIIYRSSKLFASKSLTRVMTYNFRVKKLLLYISNNIDDKTYDQDSEYHKSQYIKFRVHVMFPKYINKQQTIEKIELLFFRVMVVVYYVFH